MTSGDRDTRGMEHATSLTRSDFEALDRNDPLSEFRSRFALPAGLIYLDGNSLGAMPLQTPARLQQVIMQEWGQGLVRGWSAAGWVDLPQRLGDKVGRIIGARPGETLVADSTSVNLFKLLAMALRLRPQRRVILSESGNFPTDLYIAEGLVSLLAQGHVLRSVAVEDIEQAIGEDVAVVLLSHISYRSGRMHDLAAITAKAHAAGALVLWDLAHSAGAVPLALAEADVDFAVGCGYKYLNGGPGAPAFLYIAQRLHDAVATPLSGWFGHARPFDFAAHYVPAAGVVRAMAGTPPILSMAALEVGVDLLLEAPMAALREKSLRQTRLFAELAEQALAAYGLRVVSPREDTQRGSQVCLQHEQAWPLSQALIARGVIGDFRAPDILRFGFTPLYVGYAEIWDAVAVLAQLLRSGDWDQPQYHARARVT